MNYYGYEFIRESDLAHHGIKGQKWGQRRFQNEDGTWTAAGKERYGDDGGTRSAGGRAHRALAKVYSINERTYNKLGNKTLASMNAAAKNQQLQKAEAADRAKQAKTDAKNEKRLAKEKATDERLERVAKNAETAALSEYAVRKMAKRDIQKGQGAVERVFKNLSGYNARIATATLNNARNQVMADRRKTMTKGQKVADFMFNGGQAVYSSGGYKKLADTYKSNKDSLISEAKKTDKRMRDAKRLGDAYRVYRSLTK